MVRIKQIEREQVLEQTKTRLFQAAAQEFARAGYSDANINMISTNAGFAKGTIYNYFPSKRALLLALIDTSAKQHFNFIVDRVGVIPDPRKRIEMFYQAGFDYVSQNLSAARVMFNTINGPDVTLKAHIFEVYQPLFQFVADQILNLGIEQGVFEQVDTASMALLLMTIYLGTASQLDLDGRPWLDPNQIVDLVLNGLQKKEATSGDHD